MTILASDYHSEPTAAVPNSFRRTEVGVIPNDWEVKQVTDVCGFIVPGRNKPKKFGGDIPWVTTPDLTDGGTVSVSRLGLCVTREEARAVGSKIVPNGSVLMSCAGELGIVAITERDMVINQQLHAFIPIRLVDGPFIKFALKTRMEYIDSIATKTATICCKSR
jgi:type I restriction enzyme, S subunit